MRASSGDIQAGARRQAGQVLRFGLPKTGARAYVAVAAGIDVPVVLGSRSTYALGALAVIRGDALSLTHTKCTFK